MTPLEMSLSFRYERPCSWMHAVVLCWTTLLFATDVLDFVASRNSLTGFQSKSTLFKTTRIKYHTTTSPTSSIESEHLGQDRR